jgi:hypothetical protein
MIGNDTGSWIDGKLEPASLCAAFAGWIASYARGSGTLTPG